MTNLFKFISISLFSSLLSIIASFILARILSVEDRGIYQLLLTILNYITVISSAGVGFAIVQSIRIDRYRKWEGYLALSLFIAITFGCLTNHYLHIINNTIVLLTAIVFSVLYSYLLEISKIEIKLKIYKLLIIFQPALFLIAYLFIYVFYKQIEFNKLSYILAIILFTQGLFCIFFIYRLNSIFTRQYKKNLDRKFVIRTWVKQNILQVFGFSIVNIDKFIIAFYLGNYTLGLYTVGMTFDLLLSRIMLSLADYYYSGLMNKVNRIKNIIIFSLFILILSILLLPYFSKDIIKFFFGEKYLGISEFMIWFVVNSVLSGLSWILTQKLLILGKQILIFIRQIISLMIFLITFFIFKETGLNGIIYSLLLSSSVRLLITLYYHQKYKLFDQEF